MPAVRRGPFRLRFVEGPYPGLACAMPSPRRPCLSAPRHASTRPRPGSTSPPPVAPRRAHPLRPHSGHRIAWRATHTRTRPPGSGGGTETAASQGAKTRFFARCPCRPEHRVERLVELAVRIPRTDLLPCRESHYRAAGIRLLSDKSAHAVYRKKCAGWALLGRGVHGIVNRKRGLRLNRPRSRLTDERSSCVTTTLFQSAAACGAGHCSRAGDAAGGSSRGSVLCWWPSPLSKPGHRLPQAHPRHNRRRPLQN